MNKSDRIYIAGHRGMVGSALERRLRAAGYNRLLLRTHAELDLTRQSEVEAFFDSEKPDYVFLAAARVGGILANASAKAAFFYENTLIAANVIHAAWRAKVRKLCNFGSSCIYPREAPQPLREESLLTGPLEPTNDAYALAKIGAIKMCRFYNDEYGTNFISLMPCNLYGYNDNFDLATSHVLPAMLRKFHDARTKGTPVVLWGDGSPRREFLFADDLADAALFLMQHHDASAIGAFVNVGTGEDLSLRDLADRIAQTVGVDVPVTWDKSKPNGTPRKVLDVTTLHALGWQHGTSLEEGLRMTYDWYSRHPAV